MHLVRRPAEKCVFINCPFDDRYAELFDSILFTTVCCGFHPRSALESGDASRPRMERIAEAIMSSKYSVHDLTRCTGSGPENLARFNMPLELGMAIARSLAPFSGEHQWIALVPDPHSYKKFVSDLGAYDLPHHDGTPEALIPALVQWLATRQDAIPTPSPRTILVGLSQFQERGRELRFEWGGLPPWESIVQLAGQVALGLPGPGA